MHRSYFQHVPELLSLQSPRDFLCREGQTAGQKGFNCFDQNSSPPPPSEKTPVECLAIVTFISHVHRQVVGLVANFAHNAGQAAYCTSSIVRFFLSRESAENDQ